MAIEIRDAVLQAWREAWPAATYTPTVERTTVMVRDAWADLDEDADGDVSRLLGLVRQMARDEASRTARRRR